MVGRKICTAIRHVAFEDLGSFEAALVEAGYEVRYVDVGLDDLDAIAPTASDLLVVLGAGRSESTSRTAIRSSRPSFD